jgi:hypothetical protein
MGGSAGRPATVLRRLGLDRNPVRRSADRAEAWLRIGLLAVFLLAAPASAIGAGRWCAAVFTARAHAQAAAGYQVPATVVSRAPRDYPAPGGPGYGWARARWTAPDGTARSGLVGAPWARGKGATVRIWTDSGGRLAEPPLGRDEITSRAVTFGALAPVLLGLLLLAVGGLVRRVLDQRRMEAWEAGWAAVEPLWTRRLLG